MLKALEAEMDTNEDLPYDPRLDIPGTPEYEAWKAQHEAYKRNSSYYDEHAEELLERYPGPCVVIVVNDDEVRSFQEDEELDTFLRTLSDFERASALVEYVPEPGSVLIPTFFTVQ